MNAIKSFAQKIYLFFFAKPQPAKKEKAQTVAVESSVMGQFNNIQSMLDSLDDVFADMRRLTPRRHEAQALVRRYGPYVATLDEADDTGDGLQAGRLDSGFKAYGLPSLLISYMSKRWSANRGLVSDFLVATRLAKLPFFHPKNGCTYYTCTYVFILDGKPVEILFCVEVDKRTGQVSAMPYLAEFPHFVNGHKVSAKRRLYYPDLHDDMKHHTIDEKKAHLADLFCVHYNLTMNREMGINIIIKNGRQRCTVTIPPNRWKDFFKDRIAVPTKSGRSKPIFHAVTSHYRKYKTGKVTGVKTHYRGLRKFKWKKYELSIVLPGKHARSQASFGLEAELDDNAAPNRKTVEVSSAAVSDQLNRIFEG